MGNMTRVCSCRCMMDSDDEVRDRATFYMNVLQQKQKALNAAYIFNGTHTHTHTHTNDILLIDNGCWSIALTSHLLSVALRSVCVHPRPGEVPAPIHSGSLGETIRHEVSPSGHHSDHRTENRYNHVLFINLRRASTDFYTQESNR